MAYCISRHGSTKVTILHLVYGQKVILRIDVNLAAYRLTKQNKLYVVDYYDLMMNSLRQGVANFKRD
jgi:hypothetical protein